MASTRSRLDEIAASFATLEDPRSEINRRHPLPERPGHRRPGGPRRRRRADRHRPMGQAQGGPPDGPPRPAPRHPRQGRLPPRPDGPQARRPSRPASTPGSPASATRPRPRRASSGRSSPSTARRPAAATTRKDGLGPLHVVTAWAGEYRPGPGAGGLRREVQRDHRDPRAAEEGRRPGRDRHDRRDGDPEGDRRRRSSAARPTMCWP